MDIRRSTELFKNKDSEMVAKIIQSFASETIRILDDGKHEEIGIRGDCVYGIYPSPYKSDVYELFDKALFVNTLVGLLNRHYSRKGYRNIKVGIGLSVSEDLVVKAGATGSGVHDRVWIGDAVTEASNLSKYGNKSVREPIVMTESFYTNIKEKVSEENGDVDWFHRVNLDGKSCISCNVVKSRFDNWLKNNSGL